MHTVKEVDLLLPVHLAEPLEVGLQAPVGDAPPLEFEVHAIAASQVARGTEADAPGPQTIAQFLERLSREMEALLGTHPGQVPHDQRRLRGFRGAVSVTFEVDPETGYVDAGRRQVEQLGHRRRVVLVRRDEDVDLANPGPHFGKDLRPVGVLQVLEENVLALEAANDERSRQHFAKVVDHAQEHGVRQVNDIGLELVPEPLGETLELRELASRLAAHHGEGQFPQLAGVRRCRGTRHSRQETRIVQQPAQTHGRPAPERQLLLQVDVHRAIEDSAVADVLLVGPQRRVDRQQDRVVASLLERAHQGVVVNATSADHAAGACRQVGDS